MDLQREQPELTGEPITEVEVRALIRWKVARFETLKAAAHDAGISPRHLRAVLNSGAELGRALPAWVGVAFEFVRSYRKRN